MTRKPKNDTPEEQEFRKALQERERLRAQCLEKQPDASLSAKQAEDVLRERRGLEQQYRAADARVQARIAEINDPHRRQVATLRERQEGTATELFYTSKAEDPQRHAALEDRYNECGRQLHETCPGRKPYVPKHDVREEYRVFPPRETISSDGSRWQKQVSYMPNHDRDTVLGWRRTLVGQREDKATRDWCRQNNMAPHDGDDVGHLIALEFGVDPRERSNVTPQNSIQNRNGGTYRQLEQRLGKNAQPESDRPSYLEVTAMYNVDKHGEFRPAGRKAAIVDRPDPQDRTVSYELLFMNSCNRTTDKAKLVQDSSERWEKPSSGYRAAAAGQADDSKTVGKLYYLDAYREKAKAAEDSGALSKSQTLGDRTADASRTQHSGAFGKNGSQRSKMEKGARRGASADKVADIHSRGKSNEPSGPRPQP